jgi:hypothetical protein
MTLHLTQWDVHLHCTVFHYTDCILHPELILALIDETMDEFRAFRFDGKLTANPLGSFKQRRLLPNQRNWAKVRLELQAGQVSTLTFGSLRSDRRDWQLGVAFQLFNAPQRLKHPHTEGLHDLMDIWIDSSVVQQTSLDACWHVMYKAWERLNASYAYADVFISHHSGAGSPLEEPIAERALKAKLWTWKASRPGIDLRSNVPDAYWLNFLNASHVDRLGGIEQIKAKLPSEMSLEPLVPDGLAITISPSPIYERIERWETDHAILRQMLEPLIVNR